MSDQSKTTAYMIEVTPNPGPEPTRFVPFRGEAGPIIYPSRIAAEHAAVTIRRLAARIGGWQLRIVEAANV